MADTRIKICGLQSVEVIKSILPLQVDMIGFVLAESRRRVTPAAAGAMIRAVREWASEDAGRMRPRCVGVFVNPTLEELERTLQEAEPDVVQLHGRETPAFCRMVKENYNVQVLKVLPMEASSATVPALVSEVLDPFEGCVDGILLDTYDPVYGGGSGKTFDWNVVELYQSWANKHHLPLLIAGGLHAGNVGELIASCRPDGVDVSSGVEQDGVKDIGLITAFVERVRSA
jgi:phosphoribosylanthranilate isomerase